MTRRVITCSLHKQLADIVRPHIGKVFTFTEVQKLFFKETGDEKVSKRVQATDHCCNVTNKEPCDCAKTKRALFGKLEGGGYCVLAADNDG